MRALDPEVRSLLQQRITEIVHAGAVLWRQGRNRLSARLRGTDQQGRNRLRPPDWHQNWLAPARRCAAGPAITGSERLRFHAGEAPGSYLLIGNGDGDKLGACMVHNPGYDFNDANLAIGAAYWALLARRYLV